MDLLPDRGAVRAVFEPQDAQQDELFEIAEHGRRDAILRAYLPKVNPLVHPTLDVSTGILNIENAAVAADVAPAPAAYDTRWYTFDNATGESTLIEDPESADVAHIQAPAALPSAVGAFVRVDVSAVNAPYPSWSDPVRVYFRRLESGWKLVGLERLPN